MVWIEIKLINGFTLKMDIKGLSNFNAVAKVLEKIKNGVNPNLEVDLYGYCWELAGPHFPE